MPSSLAVKFAPHSVFSLVSKQAGKQASRQARAERNRLDRAKLEINVLDEVDTLVSMALSRS